MTSKLTNDDKTRASKRSSNTSKTISNQNYRMRQMTDVFPSLKRDLQNAKLFLQKSSNASGDSLFDHLSRVISKVVDERPIDVVDYFELYSERVRLEKFRMKDETIEVAYKEPERLSISRHMLPTFIEKYEQHKQMMNGNEMKSSESTVLDVQDVISMAVMEEEQEDEENDVIYYESPVVKDLCELQFYWNLLGIGFPREETFSSSCAMRKLKMNASISTCRFWGKIFGLKNDYYIAECTLTEDALEKRIDAIEKAINITSLEPLNQDFTVEKRKSSSTASSASTNKSKSSEIENSFDDVADATPVSDRSTNSFNKSTAMKDVNRAEYPTEWNFSMNISESTYRKPIEIPAEEIGHGVNRCVYYVCTDLYSEWTELPSVTPHQINVSRRMKKYLTGNLDAEIFSYPSFPGTERNYLRAIIARISAGTHVAPRKFYTFGSSDDNNEDVEEEMIDDEEFDEDECNNDKPIKVNPSYRPLSLEKLLKLDNWVHIKPEILKQGRICYFDGSILAKNNSNDNDESSIDENEADNEDENEAEITNIEMIPDMPLPLFTSCSSDRLTNDIISPWTIRLSDVTVVSPLVLLQSNIWSGAYAFVKDRICDNIYIGYGHKYTTLNYSPTVFLPYIEMEYPHGDDIKEANDPSPEDEKEWQRQHEITQNNRNSDDKDISDGEEIDN